MGCCISKCRPEQNPPEYLNRVHHKLVISQSPPSPIPLSNKISTSPSSSSSSSSSVSSFTRTTTCNSTITSASSFSSGSSSSSLTSKDRSFSNEFLWSCYKNNPHIIRISSLKEASSSLLPAKPRSNNLNPFSANSSSSMPHKRVRSSSPVNLNRQKCLRKEAERLTSSYNQPSRRLRSPSPSLRFNGGNTNYNSPKSNCEAHSSSVSSLIRKENVKAASPNKSSRGLRHRENCSYRIGSKIEETAVKEVESKHDMESAVAIMEDIHNPLISLDCFIFL